MRICMVSAPYVAVPPQKYGGTERVIYYLTKGLVEHGHEVTLLATGDSHVEGAKHIVTTPQALFFGKTTEERVRIQRKVVTIEKHMKKIIRDHLHEFDIIHSHGFDLKDFQDFPNLTTLHNRFILSRMGYFEKRRDLFFNSISNNQQASFPDLQYVGTIYNGLDPSEFPFVEKPEDYVCFVGRMDRDKNPHQAIELALRWGAKIKVAGKIDFRGAQYFEEFIQPYLSHPLVEYLGEIAMEEKVDVLSKARLNLHPTGFREPFGLTVLEAAYCGTPTLAIQRGAMPEIIENGRTGLLVEDFVEGYHHLEEILAMDRRYIHERARLLFNYQTMAKQYEVAYEKVINVFQETTSYHQQRRQRLQEGREHIRQAGIKM